MTLTSEAWLRLNTKLGLNAKLISHELPLIKVGILLYKRMLWVFTYISRMYVMAHSAFVS